MIKIFKKLNLKFAFSFLLFTLYFTTGAQQVFASALPKPPNNLGLVGYWSMNDGVGTKATDFSGVGNTGTLNGDTAWITGKRGSGTSYDGTGDYVNVVDNATLNFGSGTFSAGAWIKTTSSVRRTVFSKFDYDGTGAVEKGFYLDVMANGTIRTGYETSASAYRLRDSTATVNDGNWHHVLLVRPDAVSANIYIDGVLSNGSILSGGTTADISNAVPFRIGYESDNGAGAAFSQNWLGSLDEVRTYNRVLTATEVTALYNSGAVKVRKSSVATGNFAALSQTTRSWRAMTASPNGNVYAGVYGGDMYMQTNGTGTFATLSQGTRNWVSMASVPNGNGNVYAGVDSGDIYMQTAGAGAFTTLSQGNRRWFAMAATYSGNVYAAVYGGDIYMQTAGTGSFNALSQTSRNWVSMVAAPNGNVYAAVDGGDIYMQTAGTGTFTALSQTSRAWGGMAADVNNNIYASVDNGDIYMQTAGTGNFTALSQTSRRWLSMTSAPNGNIYAADATPGDIYMRSAVKTFINSSSSRITAGTGLLSGLVGHWTFDGSKLSTTTATDSSTSANNGTLNGASGTNNKPQPVIGRTGQALSFDGTDDYINITDANSLDFGTADFTISTWINPTSYGGDATFFVKASGWGVGALTTGILMELESGKPTIEIRDGSARNQTVAQQVLSLGVWYNIVAVRNQAAGGSITYYVNGVAQSVSQPSGANFDADVTNAIDARIGYDATAGRLFTGKIDDFRMYNRALTAAEALQLYNMGR